MLRTTLIATTYNWKEALDLVFRSIARQSEMPDEIVIADDGSRPDTAELVAQWRARLPVPVRHVWQEDQGFRAARSRNLAIAAASGDYLIFIDGDMVLHRHFIADHKRAARPGCFVQGVRLLTTAPLAQKMLEQGIIDLGFFARGIRRRRHTIRNRALSWLVFQWGHRNQKAIRSSNQGYWKSDLLAVNGFDERMVGWGREDNELAARLNNAGIARRNLKFAALAIHIEHARRNPTGENPNDRYLNATIAQRLTWCPVGLDAHLNAAAFEPRAEQPEPSWR